MLKSRQEASRNGHAGRWIKREGSTMTPDKSPFKSTAKCSIAFFRRKPVPDLIRDGFWFAAQTRQTQQS
jgi:hypothetical protein